MKIIFDFFSTREIALIFWVIVLLIILLISKNNRKSIGRMAKLFFSRTLFIPFLLMLLYIRLIILFLYKVHFWEFTLIKDSIIWILSVAAGMFFNAHQIENGRYFKKIFIESIKWTLIIEFLINFYTFSITIELILVPFLAFIGALQGYAQATSKEEKKNEQVVSLLQNILAIIGLLSIGFVAYKTIIQYQLLFTLENLKSLLLPLLLTLLFLPFIYFLALTINYADLFRKLKYMIINKELRKNVKYQIALAGNINLNRIRKISRNITKTGFYNHEENIIVYIKSILE